MARLNFNDEGSAFFDVKLAQRGEDVFAITQLRMPKGSHCSGFVVYGEFVVGSGEDIFRTLNEGGGSIEFARGAVRFLLRWNAHGPAVFEAHCESGTSMVVIHASPIYSKPCKHHSPQSSRPSRPQSPRSYSSPSWSVASFLLLSRGRPTDIITRQLVLTLSFGYHTFGLYA